MGPLQARVCEHACKTATHELGLLSTQKALKRIACRQVLLDLLCARQLVRDCRAQRCIALLQLLPVSKSTPDLEAQLICRYR